MVGSLDPFLFFFFLFFLLFFLFTKLLASELSPDEEDGMEGDLASEEGKKTLLVKMVKDQHEVDVRGGKFLRPKHLLHSGLPEWKTTTPTIQS